MRKVANFFLVLGVAIGVVGVAAMAVGFRPSTLPPALLDLSVYKLVFIASACVLAAGALVRRAANVRTREEDSAVPHAAIGEGPVDLGRSARDEIRERAR